MLQQAEIRIINDTQTLKLFQNGALVINAQENLFLQPTYRAVVINGEVAHTVSIATGNTLFEKPELMIIFEDVLTMINFRSEA
jgi:hypothetical protein